ncbi:hypothetical protein J6590_079785 [Homalodisca vitripennis]|nr:hypothetical protein J6590_079785 [Homalodisca vitripennis]
MRCARERKPSRELSPTNPPHEGNLLTAEPLGVYESKSAWSLYGDVRSVGRKRPDTMSLRVAHLIPIKTGESPVESDTATVVKLPRSVPVTVTVTVLASLNKGVPPLPALTEQAGSELASPSSEGTRRN